MELKTKIITMTKDNITLVMGLNSKIIQANGKNVILEVAPNDD